MQCSTSKKNCLPTASGIAISLLSIICSHSDTMLLAEGCTAFSRDFVKTAGVHPLHEATTAPSAALACYRRRFLAKKMLPVDRPESLKRRQSALALTYFEWLRTQEGLTIQDAVCGGECKVK